MTMKKEITNLISAEEGTLRLNNVSFLRRWHTTNGLGEEYDGLEIRFDTLNGLSIKGCFAVEITSREYDGIIAECDIATQKFLDEAAKQITNDLRSGHWKK